MINKEWLNFCALLTIYIYMAVALSSAHIVPVRPLVPDNTPVKPYTSYCHEDNFQLQERAQKSNDHWSGASKRPFPYATLPGETSGFS